MTSNNGQATVPIHGSCDPRFQGVREVFIDNFDRGELGAALVVFVDGSKVIDVWGGHTDTERSRQWEEDTLVCFYSLGKPLAALGVLQQIDRGLLDLDGPVCRWWPEFAAAGKEKITVRELLSHRAGLQGIRKRLPEGAMLDWELMTSALAEQAPWFLEGYEHAYHTNTYGFLAGELVRRVTGKGFGEYFRENVARPLDADVVFGVPEEDMARVAELVWHPTGDPPEGVLDQPMDEQQRMIAHCYFNPSGFSSMGVMNTGEWRAAVIPSTNGHGTARGVATIYHVLAQGGSHRDQTLLSHELLDEATSVQSQGPCPVLETEVTFGLGFQRTRPDRPLGPNPRSFGHYGTGGSAGFADPDNKIGFGYLMNDIIPRWRNDRNQALIEAVYRCL
jgi:CubicO group peptidase (beta-lactamase class C family)